MTAAKPKKFKNPTKKWGIIGILSVCAIVLVFFVYYFYARTGISPSNDPNNNVKIEPYKGGPGGNHKLVTSYRDEAVRLWKLGKKEEAKVVAQKGIEENKKLTVEQQGQIPGQMGKMYDLYDIAAGEYINE